MGHAVSTRRAESAARTRHGIIEAASTLFAEHGVDAVSLRDIATVAGISHPGLLKHFASPDSLVEAVAERFEEIAAERGGDLPGRLDGLADLARRHATIPGYPALFTALARAAMGRDHTAGERFLGRRTTLRKLTADLFRRAAAENEIDLPGDAEQEARRFAAAWEGLQVISLYLPEEVDVPAALAHRIAALHGNAAGAGPLAESGELGLASILPDEHAGYATGRQRRARILDDATTLFGRGGFHNTSLRDIAERVGVGKSTLLHYFGTKEQLLAAVLRQRDARMIDRRSGEVLDPELELRCLGEEARRDASEEPGLIELYAMLSTEAVVPSHPAHTYFADRFRRTIAYFENLIGRATAGAGIHPRNEAIWLVGMWDGLQYQWLHDPATTDIGRDLDVHTTGLLARRTLPHE